MADANGGDGIPPAPQVTATPEIPIQGDTSQTPEQLDALIDQELQGLGVPSNLIAKGPTSADTTPPADPPADPADTPPETPEEPDPAADEPAGEEDVETPPEEPVDEPAADPNPPATPDDLYLEVVDAEGVTHKISKIEDLPEDFQPKSNRQALEILRDLDRLEQHREQVGREQAEAAVKAEQAQAQQEQFNAWDKEIAELGKAKRLDSKDQATVDKVFETMAAINTARQKAGNPNMITSFEDALEKYEAQQARSEAASKEKAENDRAKLKASLIGGTSSPAGNSAPVYVSGSYRSMDDVPV